MKLHDESIEVYQYNPETEMLLIASISCKSNKFFEEMHDGMNAVQFRRLYACVNKPMEKNR